MANSAELLGGQLVDAWAVERHGEKERYEAFTAGMGNRKLLWHGSQVENWVEILKEGLRVDKCRSFMFGKAVYFSDCLERSATYSSTKNGLSLFALCEVALGKHVLRQRFDGSPKELPEGHHSVYCKGERRPDPAGTVILTNDVAVPTGTLVGGSRWRSIYSNKYSEYAVHRDEQILIRYFVTVRGRPENSDGA